MPTYVHECQACTNEFEVFCKIDDREKPAECEFCGAIDSKIIIKAVGLNFPGDDWTTKNLRIQRQMREKNKQLKTMGHQRKREQPVATLAPNVDGERTTSWSDAQKLAHDKGKDTSTYDKKVKEERKAKSA